MPDRGRGKLLAIGLAHIGVEPDGSSGTFLQQLQNGAPFDLYLSADLAYPRQLVEAGAAEERDLFRYAVGRLVLWTPDGAPVDRAEVELAADETTESSNSAVAAGEGGETDGDGEVADAPTLRGSDFVRIVGEGGDGDVGEEAESADADQPRDLGQGEKKGHDKQES